MAILSNVGAPPIDLAAFSLDTTILDIAARIAVTAMSIHNTAGANRIVEIYVSPDTTSASGKRIALYDIVADASIDVGELIGQGIVETDAVIAVQQTAAAVAGDLNCTVTHILYTEGS